MAESAPSSLFPHLASETSPADANILIVDDIEANRDLLSKRLDRLGYHYCLAEDGQQCLDMMRKQDFDLVLLDIMMPNKNGYQVLEEMNESPRLKWVPVIMVSAVEGIESVIKCIELGAVDYLTKPFNPVLLKARISACLENKRLSDREREYRSFIEKNNLYLNEQVLKQSQQISSTQLAAIFAMSKLAESRDPETGEHLMRMREYCRLVAVRLAKLEKYKSFIDPDFIENIYTASPLHDIGKVGIPDSILLKNGVLNDEEWVIMKSHTVIGAETLRAVDSQHSGNAFIQIGIDLAESHHERWDGSGYPHGLSGEVIPLAGRILALGDVYDALTSSRCYKKGFTHEKSREYILSQRGKHFDPDVVDVFIEAEDEFINIRQSFPDPDE